MENAQQAIDHAIDPARAVRYGKLVEAAYSMYDSDPNNPTPTPSSPFPAGYKFVAWVQMRDFLFEEGDWTFYGVIAINTSKTNEGVLAIRGTENLIEWYDDLRSLWLDPMPGFGQVGYGFYRIYKTLRIVHPRHGEARGTESLEQAGSFANQVAAALRLHSVDKIEAVTGHSLGAALATVYAAENSLAAKVPVSMLCTFGSPLVGDRVFASKFDELGITSWRIVNDPDFFPTVPPTFLGFCHIRTEYLYNSGFSVIPTLGCVHYLETYLHLLDPKYPLRKECTWSVEAMGRLRSPTMLAPAAAALSSSTQKEITLAAPREAGTTINITIKIG